MSNEHHRSNKSGYYTEEFATLAVAAAIGVADAGIGHRSRGVQAAAQFIPLFVVDYYLLGKRETVERTDVDQPKPGEPVSGRRQPSLPWREPDDSRFTDL